MIFNNLKESVCDPHGRFRTLRNIYPVMENGEPVLYAGRRYCDFDMVAGGEPVRLRCHLRRDLEERERLGEVSAFMAAVDEPSYNRFVYLESELLVFDRHRGSVYLDVSLEWRPAGVPLSRLGPVGDKQLRGLVGWIRDFARRHAGNRLSHGRIRPDNIWVTPAGTGILTGFGRSGRTSSPGDTAALVLIGCLLVLALSDRRALWLLGPGTGCARHAQIPRLACGSGIPVKLLHTLDTALSPDSPQEALLECLDSVPPWAVGQDEVFSSWLDGVFTGRSSAAEKRRPDSKYQFVAELSDNLMRAFDGKGWSYIDKDGSPVIAGPFREADDFYEGMARVRPGDYYGVIDRRGRYILDAVYDEVEVDRESNRIIAMLDGLYGIADREGNWVVPLRYDSMPLFSEGLFRVGENDKFGYIGRGGEKVTGIIYDEAGIFRDGRAVVRYRGRRHVIDLRGDKIADIEEKN